MPKGQKSTLEFRAQACRQVTEFSRPVREVSVDLGINLGTLRRWLREQRAEQVAVAEANEQDQDAELDRLRAELKAAKDDLYLKDQEIEFLKKAAGFFAAEQRAWRPAFTSSRSTRRTHSRTTQRPAAKSNGSTKPSRNG